MCVKVSEVAAKEALLTAYRRALEDDLRLDAKSKELIDFVLKNKHKTYKYILITALLAKAAEEAVNPLCLQAGSKLPGAYDARSICHKVLVPFEMTELGKVLGGSNEPFLNKPARFPELSINNAVRKGIDLSILKALCDGLPKIKTQKEAFDDLIYALQMLIAIKHANEVNLQFQIEHLSSDAARLCEFMSDLLTENKEGETLTLVIAGLFELFMANEDDYRVEVHPVNQSGASSKEISDMDIYKNGKLYITNELKDKPFTDTDIRHAADKVIAAGKSQMNFIVGRRGGGLQNQIDACKEEYLERNFVINVVSVDSYMLSLLNMIDTVDIERYLKFILKTAASTKFKEDTIEFVRLKAEEHFGIA
jgi:hypothetical protein